MEDLSKYLPLYLGQKVVVYYENPEFAGNGDIVTLTPDLLKELLVDYPEAKVKIHCRPLSSMTEEEAWEFLGGKSDHLYDDLKIRRLDSKGIEISYTIDAGKEGRYAQSHSVSFFSFSPKEIMYVLSKGFDIFGLKEKGLALYPEDL